jgi:hypothetical protein
MSKSLTKKDLQNLGLGAVLKAGEDIGFTDQNKTAVFNVQKAFLDLENLGTLRSKEPRLVIRNQTDSLATPTAKYDVYESWRQTISSVHYLAKYNISTYLVGQLSDIHLQASLIKAEDNNFFRPWNGEKVFKIKNGLHFARFRFPKKSANTIDIRIKSKSGQMNLSPKYPGITSKEEERKAYYRWHPQVTRFSAGQSQSPYDNLNLSGFSIPYPTTVSSYESNTFNVATKIAPQFNQNNKQTLKGLILISTGDAEQKTVCYVSPHTIETGDLNTIEDLYQETEKLTKSIIPGSNNLLTVNNASWYGSGTTGYIGCNKFGFLDSLNGDYKKASIPSENTEYLRFYKINEPFKQIYFDDSVATPYGSGAWVMALSGNSNLSINTGQRGVVYVHRPNSAIDHKKKDPRKLSGPWALASGHPRAAGASLLNRGAGSGLPITNAYQSCRKQKGVIPKLLQLPSLIPDSRYIDGGAVLPEGIYQTSYTYQQVSAPSWRVTSINTGGQDTPVFGNDYSGYIVNGERLTQSQIIASGISLPTVTASGLKYTINPNGNFKQVTPLKDTYYYKFYNQLYRDNNKTLATGTWDGIIPSGVKFQVELVTCTLNDIVGTDIGFNISVIYSGYGTLDSIDSKLQTGVNIDGAPVLYPNKSAQYMVSGEVPWHQERNPFYHAFNDQGMLSYTAIKSGPTAFASFNIAKAAAVSKLNERILALVNKIFPSQYDINTNTAIGGLVYKNRKWKNLQKFKQKLPWLTSGQYSYISIPETAEPGAQTRRRLRIHASGQA